MSDAGEFAALVAAWQHGRWLPDLPVRARELARRAPRLQHRLLALELTQGIEGIDRQRLDELDRLLVIEREPHPHLRLRTAAIALELGDQARAIDDLDQALRLRARHLHHRLAARWASGSRWALSACPALLDLAARHRPRHLLPAESAMAGPAAWLMQRLEPARSTIERLLHCSESTVSPGVHRLRTSRPRITLVCDDWPVDDGSAGCAMSGARIDAADAVVRFDDTGVQPARCRALGMRTDLWVLSQPAMPTIDEPASTRAVVSQPAFAWRAHPGWASLVQTHALHIGYADAAATRRHIASLHAPPSAALTVLAHMIDTPRAPDIDMVSNGLGLSLDRWRDRLGRDSEPTRTVIAETVPPVEAERALLSTLLMRRAS